MAGVQLSVQVRNAELVKKKFENLLAEVPQIAEGRIRGRVESARKKVSAMPEAYAGEPVHHWPVDKEKRKRALRWWFAALRDGRVNPPGQYERTGAYSESWQIEKVENGYRLRSTFPAAKWIAGTARDPDMQYHIHKTRWTPLRVAMEEAMEGLPKEIQKSVVMIARKRGF